MNRLRNCIFWVAGILVILSASSCTDDTFPTGQGTPDGVDMGRTVEVTIPFKTGKGIAADIQTRAGGPDSQLSGIMVFIYENTGKPETDRRVGWYLFSNPANGSLENSTGGWIPDSDDPTCGKIKFHVPVGDCYIYLIGNATGSFLEFFPGLSTPGGSEEDRLATLEQFWTEGTPRWTGNMNTVDGYLPLVGTVNNERGDCTVQSDGTIKYTGTDGEEHTLDPKSTDESDDNSFILKRLMSKVTVNIKGGEGVTFTPKDYRFRHVPTYVSPINAAWTDEEKDRIPVTDTETVPFSMQSSNSFTVYLPENVRKATGTIGSFADREEIIKDTDGKNTLETDDGHEEHYQFRNAPKNSTYMEITGRFEGTHDGKTVSADCRYFIHFGDFGESKGYGDFSLRRDYHYTYNITVNGVKDIYVEVNDNKEAPGAESIVFEGGVRQRLDAHYEQVEMKFDKSTLSNGIYIYATTPYGNIDCFYRPGTNGTGTIEGSSYTRENVTDYTSWIKFRKQNKKGSLALYHPDEVKDVLATLDDFYSGSEQTAYYTCFVDEFYYEKHPDRNQSNTMIHLSDFINADDRTFSLGSRLKYSADGKSAVASAVYVLQQRSIACFYDLNDMKRNKYGVEIVDEIGQLVGPIKYGSPNSSNTEEMKDGRTNTINEIANNNTVNWTENGFLLSDNDNSLVAGKERLSSEEAYLACLTRNRDLNGNGTLEDDEIRWYNPARDQVLGLWIGEPAMPAEAALYPRSTEGLARPAAGSAWPIFTSTGGNNRVIYGEQGSSFGDAGSAPNGGYVRAVRNLGAGVPDAESYRQKADAYYEYNSGNRTIELFLTDNALRAFSNRELASHNERSVVNRPPKMFQVAAHPFIEEATEHCNGFLGMNAHDFSYSRLRTSPCLEATTSTTTVARNYPGDGEDNVTTASWRLPNQRELVLMVIAMSTEKGVLDYENEDDYQHVSATHRHVADRYDYEPNYLLQCRTAFSNRDYPIDSNKDSNGYMYNTKTDQIQIFWDTGGDREDYGQGTDGTAGYLCVRDVR